MGQRILTELVGTLATSLAILAEPCLFFQPLPDQAARQMNNVVQRNRLRMSLLEQFDPFFQVRTAIAEDRQRKATLLGKLAHLSFDDRPVGDVGGNQCQHVHVVVLQGTVEADELLGADSQHDKALERTRSDHVIYDPDAIRARIHRMLDLIESDSQEVVLNGGVTEAIEPMTADKLTDQSADSRSRPHRNGTFDHHSQHEPDQAEGKVAAGNLHRVE